MLTTSMEENEIAKCESDGGGEQLSILRKDLL
jgi:hypothetical protein